MKVLKAALLLLLHLYLLPAYSQKPDSAEQVDFVDYLGKWLKVKDVDEKRTNRKVRITLFPTQTDVVDRAVISSVNFSFMLGEAEKTNTSNIYFVPYTNFKGKYGIYLWPNIWLRENKWNFKGEYFFLRYPSYTWGMGGNTKQENNLYVDYGYSRVYQMFLRNIYGNLYFGLGYFLDYYYGITIEQGDNYYPEFDEILGDTSDAVSSGIAFPFIFDSRKNANNPQNGSYMNLSFRYNPVFMGSTYEWSSLYLDVRKYFSFSSVHQRILALRSYYWTVLTGSPMYFDYPSTSWEPAFGLSSRGFERARYRSNALLYFESEYRFDITDNGLWGGVVFSNLASASEFNTQQFKYWHTAIGAGIRLKFNKFSRTNITFDYAFSRDYNTYYLSIGEAF